jgi:pyruvate ferredoxin oxidoreductase delta subunit
MAKSESEMTWKDIEIGCIVTEMAGGRAHESGTWRSQRPTYDFTRCIKCGLCSLYCPEGCIEPNKDGYFEANLFYCKGCGVCAKECWPRVIKMVEEVE